MIKNTIVAIQQNLKYIINSEDDVDIIYKKILEKLKEDKITVISSYEILEFKEHFSKVCIVVSFKTTNEEEQRKLELIIKNENFINEIIKIQSICKMRYVFETFNLNLEITEKSNKDVSEDGITLKQVSYLKDKMNESHGNKNLIIELLEELKVEKIEKLSRKQASFILDKIQRKRKNY